MMLKKRHENFVAVVSRDAEFFTNYRTGFTFDFFSCRKSRRALLRKCKSKLWNLS